MTAQFNQSNKTMNTHECTTPEEQLFFTVGHDMTNLAMNPDAVKQIAMYEHSSEPFTKDGLNYLLKQLNSLQTKEFKKAQRRFDRKFSLVNLRIKKKLGEMVKFIDRRLKPALNNFRHQRPNEYDAAFLLLQLLYKIEECDIDFTTLTNMYKTERNSVNRERISRELVNLNEFALMLINEINITLEFFHKLIVDYKQFEILDSVNYKTFYVTLRMLKNKFNFMTGERRTFIPICQRYFANRYIHPLHIADPLYSLEPRSRQMQRERISKPLNLGEVMVLHKKKTPRIHNNLRTWERRNHYVFKTPTSKTKILKDKIQEENLFKLCRDMKIESNVKTGGSAINSIKNYLLTQTNAGKLLTASAWTFLATSLTQIVLHLIQCFTGGNKVVSIIGAILGAVSGLTAFAQLAEMGQLGIEFEMFETILDSKIKSYFANILGFKTDDEKDSQIQELANKFDNLLKEKNLEEEEKKSRVFKTTSTSTFEDRNLQFTPTLLFVPERYQNLPEIPSVSSQTCKLPNVFEVYMNSICSRKDNPTTSYLMSKMRVNNTSSVDNNCFWHALTFNKRSTGLYEQDMKIKEMIYTEEKINKLVKKEVIDNLAIAIDPNSTDYVKTLINHMIKPGMTNMDCYRVVAQVERQNIIVIEDLFTKPKYHAYLEDPKYPYLLVSYANQHFSKITVDTKVIGRTTRLNFKNNLLEQFLEIENVIAILDNIGLKFEAEKLRYKIRDEYRYYNTCVVENTRLEKKISMLSMSKEKIIHYAVTSGLSIISTAIALFSVFSDPKKKTRAPGKAVTDFISVSRATKLELQDSYDGIAELMSDLFGVNISPQTINKNLIFDMVEKTENYLQIDATDYLNNYQLLFEVKKFITDCHKNLNNLNEPQNKSTQGYTNSSLYLRGLLSRLSTRVTEINRNMNNFLTRQETLAARFYGAAGAGKTEFVLRKLIPDLSEKMNLPSATCSINFHKNEYWPILRGETWGVYDEFLAQRDSDPIIGTFNKIHSSAQCPLDASDNEFKAQPCPFKAIFYMSNTPYESLLNKINSQAEVGFYGRFGIDIQFVNVKQTSSQKRNNIPRGDFSDPDHYEYRLYTTQTHAGRNNLDNYYEPTPGKEAHLLEDTVSALNPYTGDTVMIKAYDDCIYGQGDNQYKLISYEQLQFKIINAMHSFEMKFKETLKQLAESLYNERKGKNFDLEDFKKILKTKGVPDEIMDEVVDRLNLEVEENEEIDHYVVNVAGQGGTGKSFSSSKVALSLSKILGMPKIEIREINDKTLKLIKIPSVIVLHDSVYDELKYINFYDAIPKPSIIFVTHNLTLKIKEFSREKLFAHNNPELEDTYQSKGFINRMISGALGKAINSQKYAAWTIESKDKTNINGFARRLGLPGNHYHGGLGSKRSPLSCTTIQTAQGYKILHRTITKKGQSTYNELNFNKYVQLIHSAYLVYINEINAPSAQYVEEDKIKQLLNTKRTFDVVVETPTCSELISLTNDLAKLLKVSAGKQQYAKAGYNIDISSRVKNCTFAFDATEFAINKNATPEEGLEIAKSMYRILLNGNADFTAHIKCAEFEVVCVDRIAHCCTTHKAPTSKFTYTINKDIVCIKHIEVTSTRDIETVVTTSTKKELVENCFNGFDLNNINLNSYGLKLEYIDYVNSLMTHDDFKGLFIVLDEKRKLHQLNLEEKSKFLEYWIMFQESKAFQIIKILFLFVAGAGLAYMVTVFGVFLAKFFTKKTHTVKVRMDDDTVLDVKYRYEIERNIENNFENIIARFWCELTDYDYGEISMTSFRKRFKDIIFDLIIPQNKELADVKEVEIVQVTLESEPQKKSRFTTINKEHIKDITRMENNKNTLYSGHKQKKENEPRHFRSATKLEGAINQKEIIRANIEKNIIKVTTNYGDHTNTMHGINIGNNVVLTMYHLVCDKEDQSLTENSKYFEITGRYLIGDDKQYKLTPIICDKARDLLVLRIDDKTHSPRKNIVSYFCSEKQKNTSLAAFYNYRKNADRLIESESFGTTQLIQLSFDTINLKKGITTYITNVLKTYGIVSGPGSCGLPLYNKMSNGADVILGLHYGSNNNYIQAVQVTREYLEKDILPCIYNLQGVTEVEQEETDEVFYECALIEYEGPDGITEQVTIDKTSYDLMCELRTDEQLGFDCLDEGEHTKWFGYTHKGARSYRLKPKYKKTPYSEEVEEYFPCVETNAVTDNAKVIDPSNLPHDRSGNPSIMIGQQNKLNDKLDAEGEQFAKHYLSQAKELLTDYYKEVYGKYKHRLLTDLEVINGLQINPREPFFGNLEPIAMDGAVGSDITSKFKITQKGQMFEKLKQKSPTGRDLYWWNDSPAAKYCVAQSYVQEEQWRQNKRCESLVQSNLKCELRTLEKVRVGKTRVFESFTTCTSNNTRKYLGTICAAIKMERQNAFSQIGIDTVDFHQIYKRFKQVGDYGEHGDFSAWDKHLLGHVIEMVADIWTDIFYNNIKVETEEDYIQKEQYHNTIKQILISNYKGIIIADGHIFTKDRGNSSGSQVTTPLNGDVNTLYRVTLILYLIAKHNLLVSRFNVDDIRQYYYKIYENHPDLIDLVANSRNISQKIQISSMKELLKITDFINYGDDVCSTIKAEFLWLLNFVQYQNNYMFLFGITYDSPNKDGSIVPFVELTELSFISRTLHLDPNLNIVTPRLKLSSVTRLLHWCTHNTFEQLTTNLNEIFDELVMYDKATWNKYAKVVEEVINPYLKKNYNNNFLIPSYNLKRTYFQDQVKYRTNSKSIDNQILTGNDKLEERDIIRLFSNLTLEGDFHSKYFEPFPQPLKMANYKITTPNYVKEQEDVHKEFDKIMGKMPMDFQYKLSGKPALIIDRYGNSFWSISCIGPIDSDLVTISGEMQRVLSKCETTLKLVDVVMCFVMAPGPSHRVQFKMTSSNGRKFTGTDNYRVKFSNLKIEASSAADVDPMPELSTGMIMPIQDSGIPTAIHQLGYSQKSTAQLAYEYAPLTNYQIPVGSTYGKVICNLTRRDLVNRFMVSAKTGDDEFSGSFIVKVVNQVNPGLTGTLLVGMTKNYLNQPTENDMLTKKRYHLDGNTAHSVELTLHPFATDNLPTRFKWPPVEAEDKYYPALVIMVKTDYVSTFDNKALYSQVQLYTKFAPDLVTFFNGFPSENNFEQSSIQTDTVGSIYDAAELFGTNARFYTDGGTFVTKKFNVPIQDLRIDFNSGISYVQDDESDWAKEKKKVFLYGPVTPVNGICRWNGKDVKFKMDTTTKIETTIELGNDKTYTYTNKTDKTTDKVKLYTETDVKDDEYMQIYVSSKDMKWRKSGKRTQQYSTFMPTANDNLKTTAATSTRLPLIDQEEDQSGFNSEILFDITPDGDIKSFSTDAVLKTNIQDYNYSFSMFGSHIKIEGVGDLNNNTHVFFQHDVSIIHSLHVPFDTRNITQVNSINSVSAKLLPAGASSLQIMSLPFLVPTPSDGAVTAGNATLYPTQLIFEKLSKYLNKDKIYLLSVNSKNYNQTLFNFIYHGPEQTVFLYTKKTEYLVSAELTDNLVVRITNSIPVSGSLPVTTYEKSGMLPRAAETFKTKQICNSKFNSINSTFKHKLNLEGQVAAAMLAGGVQGLGGGLGNYLNQKQNYQYNSQLMAQNQGYNLHQLETMLKGQNLNTADRIRNQLEADKELLRQKQIYNNLKTPGMQMQFTQGATINNPNSDEIQNSTLLETQIPQFNLQTGAKIALSKPILPGSNLNQSGSGSGNTQNTPLADLNQLATGKTPMQMMSEPISQIAHGLKMINDETEFEKNDSANTDIVEAIHPATTNVNTQNTNTSNFASLRNSHQLGANPGDKLKDLKFPQQH